MHAKEPRILNDTCWSFCEIEIDTTNHACFGVSMNSGQLYNHDSFIYYLTTLRCTLCSTLVLYLIYDHWSNRYYLPRYIGHRINMKFNTEQLLTRCDIERERESVCGEMGRKPISLFSINFIKSFIRLFYLEKRLLTQSFGRTDVRPWLAWKCAQWMSAAKKFLRAGPNKDVGCVCAADAVAAAADTPCQEKVENRFSLPPVETFSLSLCLCFSLSLSHTQTHIYLVSPLSRTHSLWL